MDPERFERLYDHIRHPQHRRALYLYYLITDRLISDFPHSYILQVLVHLQRRLESV